VRLVGPVPDGAAVMRAFDVLCLPSRWEGLGLVLLEAMRARIPVVATRAGAIPEVLADGTCGWLCEPDSVDDLVAALTRCRTDRAGTAARVAAAEASARERFDVAAMAAATCAVYSEAMSDAPVTT
jgi:glycosyltransferase involved in cell wall biosynthesis